MPLDPHRRLIDYIRISVTDRCNLRCVYCMPPDGIPALHHGEILTYEEIIRIARLALSLGISKIRLTGGEPLVRKNLLYLVRELSKLPGLQDLSLTTNGIKLAAHAPALKQAGLNRVNVSMDSLDPVRFKTLTRGGELGKVWEGVLAASAAGIRPVKINVVALDGLNGDEVIEFARLSLDWPFEIRFIEWMPVGRRAGWQVGSFISSDRILASIQREFNVDPTETHCGNGPAQMYRISGGLGTFGVISPVTRHFCQQCNRLRLTADGKIRACLFSDDETNLKGIIRNGATDAQLKQQLLNAIDSKPEGHHLQYKATKMKKCTRPMSRIGG